MSRHKPAKHPFPGNPRLKDIIRKLNDVAALSGQDRRRIVDDWIELMFWSLQNNESEYMAVIGRYHDEKRSEIAGCFRDAFHHLQDHMRATNEESLGMVWMEFCANEAMGQFFTPASVCRVIAKTTFADKAIPEGRPFSVREPTSGAGAMIVAAAKEMLCEQVDRCHFIATDLDRTCCMMTSLNMCFFNLKGLITWGNALDPLDVRAAWVTTRSYLWGGSIRPYDVEKAKAFFVGEKRMVQARKQKEAAAGGRVVEELHQKAGQCAPVVMEQLSLLADGGR